MKKLNRLNTTEELITDIRLGKMVVLMDDEDRENEGDLVIAAQSITPEAINFMAREARGLICMPMSRQRCEQLDLPLMVDENRAAYSTNFTLSIEAAEGVTTGISAADRACTIRAASNKNAVPSDIVQPGHIFPLMAQSGGVLVRAGHTEASCDLARLAGFDESAVIVEIINDDGNMARREDLDAFAIKHDLKIGTIADLIHYRLLHEKTVNLLEHGEINTVYGITGSPDLSIAVVSAVNRMVQYKAKAVFRDTILGRHGQHYGYYPMTAEPKIITGDLTSGISGSVNWDIHFNYDGTKCYILDGGTKEILSYSCSPAYDASNMTFDSVKFDLSTQISSTTPRTINMSDDGTILIVSDFSTLYKYTLSTAYDLSTATYSTSNSFAGAIDFYSDGSKLIRTTSNTLYNYNLSTAYDVSTASVAGSVSGLIYNGDYPIEIIQKTVGTNNFTVIQFVAPMLLEFNSSGILTDYETLYPTTFNSYGSQAGKAYNSNATVRYDIENSFSNLGVMSMDVGFGEAQDSVAKSALNTYYPAVTNTGARINTDNWTDINSMTATEVANGASVFYAVAVDTSTFKVVHDTNGVRSIVRNNAGTK